MFVFVSDEKDGLNNALKIFNRMVKQSELIHEIRNRQYYLKPSEKKLFKRQESIRKQKREEKRQSRQKKYYN
jgi:ribosomal protein S21